MSLPAKSSPSPAAPDRITPVVGMSISDVFLLLVRWLHLVAAASWVGGGVFYMLVLRPAIRRAGESGSTIPAAVGREFRSLVGLCIAVLVLTGAILTFDRLTSPATDTAYVATLAVKVSLAVIMFIMAHRARRARRTAPDPSRRRPRAAWRSSVWPARLRGTVGRCPHPRLRCYRPALGGPAEGPLREQSDRKLRSLDRLKVALSSCERQNRKQDKSLEGGESCDGT